MISGFSNFKNQDNHTFLENDNENNGNESIDKQKEREIEKIHLKFEEENLIEEKFKQY